MGKWRQTHSPAVWQGVGLGGLDCDFSDPRDAVSEPLSSSTRRGRDGVLETKLPKATRSMDGLGSPIHKRPPTSRPEPRGQAVRADAGERPRAHRKPALPSPRKRASERAKPGELGREGAPAGGPRPLPPSTRVPSLPQELGPLGIRRFTTPPFHASWVRLTLPNTSKKYQPPHGRPH